MLPQLPFELPSTLPALPALPALPKLPPSLGEIPQSLTNGSPWTWAIAGAVIAVTAIWAVRRARRMALAAAVGVTGLVLAWNTGFLPLSS